MRHLVLSLAEAVLALPPCVVSGDQPPPHRDSHSYAKRAVAYVSDYSISASDLAWVVAGLGICHAEAVDASTQS